MSDEVDDVLRQLASDCAQAAADQLVYGDELEWRKKVAAAVASERARCRAIVMRHFGSDWNGNKALEEIDHGE